MLKQLGDYEAQAQVDFTQVVWKRQSFGNGWTLVVHFDCQSAGTLCFLLPGAIRKLNSFFWSELPIMLTVPNTCRPGLNRLSLCLELHDTY